MLLLKYKILCIFCLCSWNFRIPLLYLVRFKNYGCQISVVVGFYLMCNVIWFMSQIFSGHFLLGKIVNWWDGHCDSLLLGLELQRFRAVAEVTFVDYLHLFVVSLSFWNLERTLKMFPLGFKFSVTEVWLHFTWEQWSNLKGTV